MLLSIKKWAALALVAMLPAAAMPASASAAQMGAIVGFAGDGSVYQTEMNLALSGEQKEVLARMCEIIPGLSQLTEISSSTDEGSAVWSIHLQEAQDAGNPNAFTANASLTFDTAVGELIWFDFRNPAWASNEPPSQQFAAQQADAFIKQLLGDKADQYQLCGFGGSGSTTIDSEGNEISWHMVTVNYYPLINGVPFLNRTTQVSVDSAGHVTGYYHYDQLVPHYGDGPRQVLDLGLFVPPEQAVVSLAEAEQIMAEKTTMELKYLANKYFYSNDPSGPALVYVAAESPGYIDALTGKPVTEVFGAWQPHQEQIKLVGRGEKMLARSRAEAEELLSRQLGLDISKMDYNEQENDILRYPEEEIWYDWYMTIDGGQPDTWLTISVSMRTLADSGEVVGFNMYSGKEEQGDLSQEAALATALGFMERVLPEGPAELQLTWVPSFKASMPEWVDQTLVDQEYLQVPPNINFIFTPLHQGIQIADAGYHVAVSEATGTVVGYSRQSGIVPADLPDADLAVSAEQAKAEYLKNTPLQLAYIWPEWLGQRAPEPFLVYTANSNMRTWYYIDALTGRVITIEPTAS